MGRLVWKEKYEYKGRGYIIQVLEYELGFETRCLEEATNEQLPVRWAIHYKEYHEILGKGLPEDPFRSMIDGSKKTIRWWLGDETFPI